MAKYELAIYGENDEVIKKYETDHIRWDVFLNALKLHDEIKDNLTGEAVAAIGKIVKTAFIGMTDEELAMADGMDVINTFKQLVFSANKIESSKNV